jgi:hypothetical protein
MCTTPCTQVTRKVEGEDDLAEDKLEGLYERAFVLKNRLAALEDDIEKKEQKKRDVEARMASINDEELIEAYQELNEALNLCINNLMRGRNDIIRAQIANLKAQKPALEERNRELRAENRQHKDERNQLKTRKIQLQFVNFCLRSYLYCHYSRKPMFLVCLAATSACVLLRLWREWSRILCFLWGFDMVLFLVTYLAKIAIRRHRKKNE